MCLQSLKFRPSKWGPFVVKGKQLHGGKGAEKCPFTEDVSGYVRYSEGRDVREKMDVA